MAMPWKCHGNAMAIRVNGCCGAAGFHELLARIEETRSDLAALGAQRAHTLGLGMGKAASPEKHDNDKAPKAVAQPEVATSDAKLEAGSQNSNEKGVNKEDEIDKVPGAAEVAPPAESPQKKKGDAEEAASPPPAAYLSSEAMQQHDAQGGDTGQKRTPAGSSSTVVGKLVQAEGNPRKALRKYIASFGDGSATFGNSAPCRSYRALTLLSDFDETRENLKKCKNMAEIQAEQKRWTLFKNALRDLMGMCKAAVTRLNSSAKSARNSSENQKRAAQDAAQAPPSKKAKKVTNSKPTSLFQWIPAEVKGITSMRLDTESKPESEVNFLQPMIFRMHPEAQTLYLYI